MSAPPPEYSQLRAISTLVGLPIDKAVTIAAHLVDGAGDRASAVDLQHAITLIEELLTSPGGRARAAELHYFNANAWSSLRMLRHASAEAQLKWRQLELESEILCVRRARHTDTFSELPVARQAQVLTNTGNLLNTVGRSLEALDSYDEALRILPNFGMAMGNRAIALKEFARSHYDRHQSALLLHRAARDFSKAPVEHFEPGAEVAFNGHAEQIRSWLAAEYLAVEDPAPIFPLGKTKGERAYRGWALRERLFLNPLLGLGAHSC